MKVLFLSQCNLNLKNYNDKGVKEKQQLYCTSLSFQTHAALVCNV